MTAKELRKAGQLWPENLTADQLKLELIHHSYQPDIHPIALRMLRDEVARRMHLTSPND